jgi:hypothetical protein
MAATPQALESLNKWTTTMNTHYVRCKGEFYGDAPAWHDLYHDPAITNETMKDRLDWMEVIRLSEPGMVSQRAENIFKEAQKYMILNEHKARCFDKGIGKNRHQPLFKACMEMRDVMNKLTGWEMPKPKKPDDDSSHWDSLFNIKD